MHANAGFAQPDSIERTGVVVRVSPKRIWIRCEAASGCALCASGKGCRGSLLAALPGGDPLLELDRGGIDAAPGDVVRVRIRASAVERAAALAYGMPTAGLLLGAAAGALVLPQTGDAATVAGAALGLASGVAAMRRRFARSTSVRELRPELVAARPGRAR